MKGFRFMGEAAVEMVACPETVSNVVALPFCHAVTSPADRPFVPSDEQRQTLNRLRWLAMRAALTGNPDLEEACYTLAGDPGVTLERYAILFFRGLNRYARSSLSMHRPGAGGLTRDEVWLLRLVDAVSDERDTAFNSLMAWHVQPKAQRWMRFLARGLSLRLLES